MSVYTDTIRRWATDDRRAGVLADADGTGEIGLGEQEAGRRLAVRFTLRLRDDRVEAVRYQVFGCGFTIAACAAAAELAEGRTLSQASLIAPAMIDATLGGLPAERAYCAELAGAALRAAVGSAGNGRRPVTATLTADDDHAPRVTVADPVYRLLIDSPAPPGVSAEDRHLYACLLAVASGASPNMAAPLGLASDELTALLHRYFPAVTLDRLRRDEPVVTEPLPATDGDVIALLLGYLPHDDDGWAPVPSVWLAKALAARSAVPGHLWIAMGLFERPQLTAAIRRHLPALAEANDKGMRWKRFFFRQLCEQGGGMLCKSPDCGACSDYTLCFGGE